MKYPLPSVQGGWQNFFSAKGPEMQLHNRISSLKLSLGPGNAVVQLHFWFDTWPWGGNAVAQLHFYAQP
jgi:hypothetical protein